MKSISGFLTVQIYVLVKDRINVYADYDHFIFGGHCDCINYGSTVSVFRARRTE